MSCCDASVTGRHSVVSHRVEEELSAHPGLQAFVSEALCAPWELSSLTITELLTLQLAYIHSPMH